MRTSRFVVLCRVFETNQDFRAECVLMCWDWLGLVGIGWGGLFVALDILKNPANNR